MTILPPTPEQIEKERVEWRDCVRRTVPSWQIKMWLAAEEREGINRYVDMYREILAERESLESDT